MGRYPWAEVLLFEVLHILVFYPTRQHAYRVVVLAAMIYVAAQIYPTQEVTERLTTTFFVGFSIAFRFTFTAYLLLTEGSFPDHWRRARDEVHAKADASGLDNLPSNFPLKKKIWWMVDIAYSKTFLKLIMNTLITDVVTSAVALNPAFDNRVHDPTDGPETYLAGIPLLRRAPYVLIYSLGVSISLSAAHNAVALACVGLGQSNPTLWPDLWGSWGNAYTVRKFWGQTWHQWMRPTVSGFGRLVANKFLKFPRGTNRSSYTQLYIAFLISGLLHFAGDFMLEKRLAYHSFKFFLLQAVAITFEDFVVYLAKRLLRLVGIQLKPGRVDENWAEVVVRVVGYCWVTLWFCLTLPVWLDEPDTIGFTSGDRGPITRFLLDRWKLWT